jgi:hypothetical protein
MLRGLPEESNTTVAVLRVLAFCFPPQRRSGGGTRYLLRAARPVEPFIIPVGPSVIPIELSDAHVEASEGRVESFNIPFEPFNGPLERFNIPLKASDMPLAPSEGGVGEADRAGQPGLTLVFDRAINASAFVASQVVVSDGSINNAVYAGVVPATVEGPTRISVALAFLAAAPSAPVTLTATALTGLVAADDGGTWAGVSELGLPFDG